MSNLEAREAALADQPDATADPGSGAGAGPARPLVVDMDGTLTRSDTLHEAMLLFAARHPARLPALLPALRAGKAAFKRRLADATLAETASLPLNETVLELLRRARSEGRRTLLVSAADQRQVEAMAARVGLFDEAHGTGGAGEAGPNLSGAAKARFLVERFGRGGFDYVGDSREDLAVWSEAREAITVGAAPALRAAAERANPRARHLAPRPEGLDALAPYLRALRPHQWLKNVLVFLPVLAAHDPGALGTALAAFVAFSLTASSVYLINDLLDLSADRAHATKRARPFASGALPVSRGLLLAPLLALAALAVALAFAPPLVLGVLALYYALTFAYSLVLKRKLIVDVWTLAGLYTLRILGGAAATATALSPWMLAFSMFLFLSLAAVKRQAELGRLAGSGKGGAGGRAYRADDLPVLREIALAAGYAAVLVFALYINSPKVVELYSRPELLWLVCPLLLYWVSWMVMVTHRGRMTDDPMVFAMKSRISLTVVAMAGAAALAAAFA